MKPTVIRRLMAPMFMVCGLVGAVSSVGAEPAIFVGADIPLGERLMAEHRCAQCHTSKVGGDGSAIYKPAGRVNNPGALRGMVEQCNVTLNLQMFPEEVTAVSAVLNKAHYKFK